MSTFEEDVLECLSIHQWKSGRELTEELSARYKKEGRRKIRYAILKYFLGEGAADEMVYPSISGRVYVVLDRLTEEGDVECRFREEPEEVIEARGGIRKMEWRLTKQGHRKRIENATPATSGAWLPTHA